MIDFDKLLSEYIEEKYTPIYKKLDADKLKVLSISIPSDLSKFKKFYTDIGVLRASIYNIDIKLNASELVSKVEEYYSKELEAYQDKEYSIHQKYEALIDSKKNELKQEAELHNNSVTEEWAANNQQYIKLEEKRKVLLGYSKIVQQVCDTYGILSTDCNMCESDFTVEALDLEYDKALNFLRKHSKSSNVITTLKEYLPNVYAQAGILFVVFVLCFTPLLDVFSIAFIVALIVKQLSMDRVVSTYALIYALCFNIQPLNMGYAESVDNSALESVDITDEDSRLDEIVDDWESELNELDSFNPQEELSKAKNMLSSMYVNHQSVLSKKLDEFKALKEEVIKTIDQKVEYAKKQEADLKSNIKYLNQRFNTGYVLDTNFALGLTDGSVEEFVNIGCKNVIIRPGADRTQYVKFMQVMLANAYLNVKGNLLDVTIIDPNYKCRDFMSFYEKKVTDDNLHLNSVELQDMLKSSMDFLDKNMKEMRGLKIAEYNQLCQERNAAPRDYKLIIVASQPKELIEKEEWLSLLTTSAEYGLMFWIVTDAALTDLRDSAYFFEAPFEGVKNPYPVDLLTFSEDFKECYKQLLKNSKLPPLTFGTFVKSSIPDNKKWWNRRIKSLTDKSLREFYNDFIDICPGYYEGDPAKADNYTFGHQGNVHIIGVGGTGAGKSVFLNFVILCLCTLYSPEELELWLVDYKGAEFKKYIASPLNGFKALPHVKACLCTSDGDYAGSLYKAYREDSEERYKLFKDNGVGSLKEYNTKVTAQGHPEKRLPRILMINDEFQVIFEKADPKILEEIKKDMTYIAKVGRASGHHLFFTSQSMNKTLSADILEQFTLRFVLRCSLTVSNDILGNKAAGMIKEANGFLYVRSYDNDFANDPPRYRTPFINDERPKDERGNETGELSEVEKAICNIYDEAQKIGFKQERVITYSEDTIHNIEEIDMFYEKYKSKANELEDLFLLGESMTYTKSVAPQHVKLTSKNNNHIFSVFNNYDDLVNFYKTIIRNIRLSTKECDFIVNAQVADLHYLCEVDKDLEEDLLPLSNEKLSALAFISFVKQIYDKRVESELKDRPMYIICVGWDKADGIGVNKNMVIMQQLQSLLQVCAEYHIHFIFICTGIGAISLGVRDACLIKVCGKATEDDSMGLLGTKQAYKSDMKSGFFYMSQAGEVVRAKVYQYEKTRQIKLEKLSF